MTLNQRTIFMSAVCVMASLAGCSAAPGDKKLLDRFADRRSIMEEIVRTLDADSTVLLVSTEWSAPPDNVNPEKWEEIVAALQNANLLLVRRSPNGYYFVAYQAGLSVSFLEKGYAYLSVLPRESVRVDDVEKARRESMDDHLSVYRHIDNRWYLYLESS